MNQQNNKTNKQGVSLLLLTKNESKNLREHLTWLHKCPNINQVIVVDDHSTDSTISTLKELVPKTINLLIKSRGLDGNFSAQRQYGTSLATNNWILWLDADEEPSHQLISYLNSFEFDQTTNIAFKRHDFFLGGPLNHGETANQYFLRLFHRNSGGFTGMVHEIWHSNLPTKQLDIYINHYSHPTIQSFMEKINFYSSLRAQELYCQKVTTNLSEIIFYPLGKFLYNYFILLGLLDSTRGIIMALGMSFHSFLVRAKLWHLYQSPSI